VDDEKLPISKVAKRLGVDRETIRLWIHDGEFPNAHKLRPSARTSKFVIPESDVVAYEERQRSSLTTENQE
jgi:excisionase family DNA binding protein